MSSPELVATDRLEELLAGAFPETHAEARLQGMTRELRSASWSSAPSSLRRSVDALGAEGRARVRVPHWKLAVVLAGLVLGVFAAVTTIPHTSGSESGQAAGTGVGGVAGANESPDLGKVSQQALETGKFQRAGVVNDASGSAGSLAPPIPAGRAQDVNMWIDLRVKDADELSSAAQQAQSITRELGGVVGSSNVQTEGKQGHAELTLRIPIGKVGDATFRLSQLGTITGQRVSTTDLQGPLDRLSLRIERLRDQIKIELARLASGQLDATEELQAQIRLVHLRRNLRDAVRQQASIARQASMADLSLKLATPTGAAPQKSEGGISGAAGEAVNFLRGAGAVVVFLALVLSPLIVLVVLAWLVLRARNRRIEARLLDEPRPGAPAEKPSS
jgi:Domain of unknown function (DUF4349)